MQGGPARRIRQIGGRLARQRRLRVSVRLVMASRVEYNAVGHAAARPLGPSTRQILAAAQPLPVEMPALPLWVLRLGRYEPEQFSQLCRVATRVARALAAFCRADARRRSNLLRND
jgi:hypothetical protein